MQFSDGHRMYNTEGEDGVHSPELWTILGGNGFRGMDLSKIKREFLTLNAVRPIL